MYVKCHIKRTRPLNYDFTRSVEVCDSEHQTLWAYAIEGLYYVNLQVEGH